MSTIFDLKDTEGAIKTNMDELYIKKTNADQSKLDTYNKILNRIHNKIKTVSKYDKYNMCWYLFPEVILGVPLYDLKVCISYCIEKLTENGFVVRYTDPNLLFISWDHWVPSYVRKEIKNKTGVNLDGYGNVVDNEKQKDNFNLNYEKKEKKKKKTINQLTYKPSGKFIYIIYSNNYTKYSLYI